VDGVAGGDVGGRGFLQVASASRSGNSLIFIDVRGRHGGGQNTWDGKSEGGTTPEMGSRESPPAESIYIKGLGICSKRAGMNGGRGGRGGKRVSSRCEGSTESLRPSRKRTT